MNETESTRLSSFGRTLFIAVFSFALGAASVVGVYLFAHRTTEVWVATNPVNAEGIVIPAGTKLIHESAMSEGFHVLRLYLNVGHSEDAQFKRVTESRSFLVIPYWVGARAKSSSTSQGRAVPNNALQRTRYARR